MHASRLHRLQWVPDDPCWAASLLGKLAMRKSRQTVAPCRSPPWVLTLSLMADYGLMSDYSLGSFWEDVTLTSKRNLLCLSSGSFADMVVMKRTPLSVPCPGLRQRFGATSPRLTYSDWTLLGTNRDLHSSGHFPPFALWAEGSKKKGGFRFWSLRSCESLTWSILLEHLGCKVRVWIG